MVSAENGASLALITLTNSLFLSLLFNCTSHNRRTPPTTAQPRVLGKNFTLATTHASHAPSSCVHTNFFVRFVTLTLSPTNPPPQDLQAAGHNVSAANIIQLKVSSAASSLRPPRHAVDHHRHSAQQPSPFHHGLPRFIYPFVRPELHSAYFARCS